MSHTIQHNTQACVISCDRSWLRCASCTRATSCTAISSPRTCCSCTPTLHSRWFARYIAPRLSSPRREAEARLHLFWFLPVHLHLHLHMCRCRCTGMHTRMLLVLLHTLVDQTLRLRLRTYYFREVVQALARRHACLSGARSAQEQGLQSLHRHLVRRRHPLREVRASPLVLRSHSHYCVYSNEYS